MSWARASEFAARPPSFTENGDYISGYMPPRELVQQLKELQLAQMAKR